MPLFSNNWNKRRRDDYTVTLRKQKRNEFHTKRRKIGEERINPNYILEIPPDFDTLSNWHKIRILHDLLISKTKSEESYNSLNEEYLSHSETHFTNFYKDIPQEYHYIQTSNIQILPNTIELYNILSCLRILIQQSKKPEMRELVKFGFLEILSPIISNQYEERIVEEACWIICNLALDTECTKGILFHNIVWKLLETLREDRPNSTECALWAIANISGDQSSKIELLKFGLIDFLNNFWEKLNENCIEKIAWIISNLSNKMPKENSEEAWSVIEVVEKLLKFKIDEISKFGLISIKNLAMENYIEEIVRSTIIKKVIILMGSSSKTLEELSVEIINLVSSSSQENSDRLLYNGILDELIKIVSSSWESIRKQVYFTISNLVAENSEQVKLFLDHPIALECVKGMLETGFEARKEASFLIRNVVLLGSSEQILHLVNLDFLEVAKKCLGEGDTEFKFIVLGILSKVLKAGKEESVAYLVHSTGCFGEVEKLTMIGNNSIASLANEILQEYFYYEDEGDLSS